MRWRIAVCAAAAASVPASAAGQAPAPTPASVAPARVPVDVTTALPGATDDVRQLVLVGRSGQLYEPGPGPAWKRSAAGGVATDVVAVVPGSGGALFAIGHRAPLFVRERGVWSAHPLPNRGRIAASLGGGVPAVAIGRHIYVREKGAWTRTISARRALTAVWASDESRIYAADGRGELQVSRGKAWTRVTHPLAKDDPVVALFGVPGRVLIARSGAGVYLRVGARSAERLELPESLVGLDVHAAGKGPGGDLVVAGVAGEAGAGRPVVVRITGKGLVPIDGAVSSLAAGDRFAVIRSDRSGRLLIATRRGSVRIRDKDGAWTDGTVSATLPPARAFPKAAPARTR